MWVDTTTAKIPTKKYSNWPILILRFWRFVLKLKHYHGGVEMLRIINSVHHFSNVGIKKANSYKLLLQSIWFATGLRNLWEIMYQCCPTIFQNVSDTIPLFIYRVSIGFDDSWIATRRPRELNYRDQIEFKPSSFGSVPQKKSRFQCPFYIK